MKASIKRLKRLPEIKPHGYQETIASVSSNSRINNPFKIEICMVSTCLSLSIISTGIIGILSKLSISVPLVLLIIVNTIAVLSAYAALWTLACSCCGSNSAYGFSEIYSLLTNPDIYKPYWLIACALLFWLIISCLVGELI